MKAAFPFIDDFLPAGTLASLERLGEVLAGASQGTARRGSAVTHATSVTPSLGLHAPEVAPAARRRDAAPGRGAGPPAPLTPGGHSACRSCSTRWPAGPPREPGVGRAVVVRTFGSAPRPEGAVLLVTDDGRIAGSVSGGCVEGAAAEEIWAARKAGRERVIRYGISDEQAWDVGLACGGTIDVLISPARPGRGGRGGARDERGPRRRPGDRHAAPRGRAAGRVRRAPAGRGERARAAARRPRRRPPRRLARRPGPRRAAGRGRDRRARPRRLEDDRGRRAAAVHRVVPGAAAARRRRRGRGRAARSSGSRRSWATRRSSSTAARRSRPRRGSRTSTG